MWHKFAWILLFSLPVFARAQFAPAAGEQGTTAMKQDSSAFTGWAVSCSVRRGFINVADTTVTYTQGDTTSNRAFFGVPANATGKPGGPSDVVSLGDGGSAVLGFAHPIFNGPGPDFAVFENGFRKQAAPFLYYLELAFVEVSTDGKHFVRFPSVSLTQDTVQIDGFGQLDPTKIHNLAGKYVLGFGTPFDLADLADSSGIDIDSINYVRIVDVVGDIDSAYARYDSRGHVVNDPWPTPFWTGGFDLNAVGVIHEKNNPQGIVRQVSGHLFTIFPNPANRQLFIRSVHPTKKPFRWAVYSSGGEVMVRHTHGILPASVDVSGWPSGLYVLKITGGQRLVIKKILIIH